MKNLSRKKKKSNVYSIADNPRFERKTRKIYSPNDYDASSVYTATVPYDFFGFPSGSIAICRSNFSREEITPTTLVICEIDGKDRVAAGDGWKNICAVIDFVQVDLRRNE